MASKPASVDAYIAQQPAPTRAALRRVRQIIRSVTPGADEVISYGIPAFKIDGRTVLYVAGWKAHYSLYPSSKALELAFEKELAPYGLSHKGTIRFPLSEPVPERLIARIARFRVNESAERARAAITAARQRRRTTRTASSRRARRR